jgi:hypothetical protein
MMVAGVRPSAAGDNHSASASGEPVRQASKVGEASSVLSAVASAVRSGSRVGRA